MGDAIHPERDLIKSWEPFSSCPAVFPGGWGFILL